MISHFQRLSCTTLGSRLKKRRWQMKSLYFLWVLCFFFYFFFSSCLLYCCCFFFISFFFIFRLYITVLVLPNITMNPPQVYTCFIFKPRIKPNTKIGYTWCLLTQWSSMNHYGILSSVLAKQQLSNLASFWQWWWEVYLVIISET